ncbi:MAG: TonB-dependent receptor [Desulfobacterium sp.]
MKNTFLKLTIISFILWQMMAVHSIAAEKKVYMMDTVVVTATRSPDKTFDVPTPISTVDEKRLQETAPASVADALKHIPGLTMEQAGSWEASPIIRGLGQNRVLVLYDGDRETNLWSGRAALTPFIDIGSVARIEVVKGPASALYGTDALGGVINIITKDVDFAKGDQWQMESTVSSRFSSNDQAWFGRYELAAGGNDLGFRLGISRRDAGDYEDGNGNDVNNSQFKNTNVDFKSSYEFAPDQTVTAAVKINNISDMGVPQKDPTAPFSHFDQFDTQSYKLGYKGKNLGVFDDFQIRTYYVHQDRSFKGHFPSSGSPVYNLKENDIETSALGSSLQTTMSPGDNHELITGLEFVHEETDSSETQVIHRNSNDSVAKQLTFQPVPDGDRYHIGIFVQDEINFDRLKIVAGGRYDYFDSSADDITFTDERFNSKGSLTSSNSEVNEFSDENDGAATFNLGLLYKLTNEVHLTTNVGSGFRAPDIFERYSTRGGGSQILIGDPTLDPEYSYNCDIGTKVRFQRIQGSANIFYTRVDDYIDTVLQSKSFISNIPTYKYTNVQDAELYGFDAETEVGIFDNLDLFANISYVVGKDRDSGDQLNNIAPLNGTIGAHWEDELRGGISSYWLEASGDFFASQDDPAPEEEATAGYGVANIRGGLKFFNVGPFHDLLFSVGIENLFDRYYLSHLRQNDQSFIAEPGINFITSVQLSF